MALLREHAESVDLYRNDNRAYRNNGCIPDNLCAYQRGHRSCAAADARKDRLRLCEQKSRARPPQRLFRQADVRQDLYLRRENDRCRRGA